MDVTGAGAVGGAAPIRPTQLSTPQGVEAPLDGGLVAPQDEVQISSAARALGQIDPGSQIHEARLAEIRAAIAEGTYETPEKLAAAVERLLAALNASGR
jgi:anti-sigma28 factor (negative regulator of flagellin synthesis)